MIENYFRTNPKNNVIGILQSRRSLWESGKTQFHIKDAMRNNAWCKVTINGLTLPRNDDTFQKTYARNAKPYPSLDTVTIKTAGEFGHALHVDVTFTCYQRSDFETFDKKWLRPRQKGEISFGYVKPYNSSEQTYINLKDLYVCLFDFNTDSNGHYICNAKLVGPSRFLEAVETRGGINDQGKFKFKSGGQSHDVTSIEELLLYDAQENGQTSTDDMADNHKVPTEFGDIIVYHPPDKGGIIGGFQRTAGRIAAQLANSGDKQFTFNHEYYSLEYICNRIVNNQLLEFLKKITSGESKNILDGVKVVCNSTVTKSVAYPDIRSANPLSTLILGVGKGNYSSPDGSGKDWELGGEAAGALIKCHRGFDMDLSKIMIERMVICDALQHARGDSEKTDKATQVKPTEKTGTLVYVKQFLRELFRTIAHDTGNFYQLDLIENPENRKELLVVDTNNGKVSTPIQVFQFNPIDGDGSTRDMQLNSNAGSTDYMAAMFDSIQKQSDINTVITKKVGEVDSKRAAELTECTNQIAYKCQYTIPQSNFGPDELDGLRQLLTKYNQLQSIDTNKRKQVVVYPGLKMNISIDGCWGWEMGNHIHTTLCPKDPYRIESNGICFSILSVVHTIKDSDWQTDLEGIMCFAAPIKLV